jgi:transcriptional regulator with GAF, ATPase, and Fis domain
MHLDSTYLRDVLDAAVALTGADLGLIHLLDTRESLSRIVAHSGPDSSVAALASERIRDERAPAGRAAITRTMVFREDLARQDYGDWVGSDRTRGYRSVSAAPLISRTGEVLGVLELLFSQPQKPSSLMGQVVRAHARIATVVIELASLKRELAARVPDAPDEPTETELKAAIRRLSTHQQNSPLRDQIVLIGEQCVSQLVARLERASRAGQTTFSRRRSDQGSMTNDQ